MELIQKQLSPEASVKVEIVSGKIIMKAEMDTKGLDALASMSVDSDYFLDELAKKIPGVVDDAVIAVLKQAIKAL
jgi:hypothetical protein